MDDPDIPALERLIAELRGVITVQRRAITDLDRQNRELRDAIAALMEVGTPRVLHNRQGVIILDTPLPPR